MNIKECVFISENNFPLFNIAIEKRSDVTEDFLTKKIKDIYTETHGDDYVISVKLIKVSFQTEIRLVTKAGTRFLDWTFFRIYQ